MSLETLQLKIGELTEAVNTLKTEVTALRGKVDELSKIKGAAGLVLAGAAGLVAAGAGVAEIVRTFFRHG